MMHAHGRRFLGPLIALLAFSVLGVAVAVAADPRLLPALRGEGHYVHPARLWLALLALPLLPATLQALARSLPERPFIGVARASGLGETPPSLYPRFAGFRARVVALLPPMLAATLVPLSLAFAEPESHLGDVFDESAGVDILVCLDLSESMQAAFVLPGTKLEDPKNAGRTPLPTRLDVAKEQLASFLEKRPDDRIGLLVFGRSAWLAAPPTADKTLLIQRLRALAPGEIDGSLTALGDAIGAATAKLDGSPARSRRILLLSDGDGNVGLDAEEGAALARRHGIVIDTLQIGDGGKAQVLVGTDERGFPKYVEEDFPVNAELLRTIAAETGGRAYKASDANGLSRALVSVLDTLEKTTYPTRKPRFVPLATAAYVGAAFLLGLAVLLRMIVLGENA
jgi:Ca-activated chloride channel family protein